MSGSIVYDTIPTLPLLFDWLRFPEQCVLRVWMDGIFRHINEACSEWFKHCALADEGEPGFESHYLPKRDRLLASKKAPRFLIPSEFWRMLRK